MSKEKKVNREAIVLILDTILAILEPLKKFRDELAKGKYDEQAR